MASAENSESQQQQLRHKVEECTNIILFKPNGQKYRDFNPARAEPNERLAEAFGIDNSFTSTDRTSNKAGKRIPGRELGGHMIISDHILQGAPGANRGDATYC
jgi:hypothetical protein